MVREFIDTLWELTLAMAPYIVFGLLAAGVLNLFISSAFITKHLGKGKWFSVIKATLLGTPMPLCSCSVIPVASAIRKQGANKGATLAFLISTPITGVDSILATYGVFGFVFTLFRLVTSVIIATVAGFMINLLDRQNTQTPNAIFSPKPSSDITAVDPLAVKGPTNDVCCQSDACDKEPKGRSALMRVLEYSFVTLFGDIAKPLFWGLLAGAAITTLIPADLNALLSSQTWLGYLLMIAVATPMYICATASLPIAAAFVLSGVSLGAVFVFLSAGPATNTVTMGVVKKLLGAKALAIYLGVIVIGSVVFGVILDSFVAVENIDVKSILVQEEHYGIVSQVSAVLLWFGIIFTWLKEKYFRVR